MSRSVPFRLKLIILLAIIYIISPIDLVADFAPAALGWIDDVIITLIALTIFLAMAPKDIVMEHIRGRNQPKNTKTATYGSTKKVIEGSYRYEDEDSNLNR
jgi:uncharacterized membrane protein YkvA (DUF1232 family)